MGYIDKHGNYIPNRQLEKHHRKNHKNYNNSSTTVQNYQINETDLILIIFFGILLFLFIFYSIRK